MLNNSTILNFNALLVVDELEAQRAISQLKAFNKLVPKDIMVFSLAGLLNLPGVPAIPAIPAIEYPIEVMAASIVKWLTQDIPIPKLMHGNLVVP